MTFIGGLIVLHTLFFFGGAAGAVPQQEGDSPHKKFVDNFAENDSLTEEASISQDAGVVETTFSPILAQTGFFQTITGWLLSPYTTIRAAALPAMFSLLLQALMGFLEAYTIYKAVRGGF